VTTGAAEAPRRLGLAALDLHLPRLQEASDVVRAILGIDLTAVLLHDAGLW
jgi:hypothetical protein